MTALMLRLALLSCLLSSCAIAPARVRRVAHAQEASTANHSLRALLQQALAEPEGAAGKHALAHFVERWKAEHAGRARGVLPAGETPGGIEYLVEFRGSDHGCEPLSYFDVLSPAEDFKVSKLTHHQRAGVGAPLLALRENRQREWIERYYPPEAITRPLTAVLQAGVEQGGKQKVRIDLLCPLARESVVERGKKQPLAADFTLPWAAALARSGKLNQSRVLDMLRRKPARMPQLYLMEPYDPRKEPLIMIHGLLSTPLAWAELSNELWADPEIRRRYQIWHFLYNTSAPALYSARLLRTQLRELRQALDPTATDPASRRTTLLTHSMGGLIGKALVVSPGDAFWKAAFHVPPESLKLSPQDRTELEEAFEWQADRSIHRILFIAVPHRGSAFADNLVGRLGTWLTAPPLTFQDFYRRVSESNPEAFTPAYRELGEGRLDSVSSLSPRQPTLRILADLPFAHPVSAHSIIGNRGREGPLEQSSDGIVPYTSSHLEQAASELIVPAHHGAFRHPQAVAEIKRVLKLQRSPGKKAD